MAVFFFLENDDSQSLVSSKEGKQEIKHQCHNYHIYSFQEK